MLKIIVNLNHNLKNKNELQFKYVFRDLLPDNNFF